MATETDPTYRLNPRKVGEELFALNQRVASLEEQVRTLVLALARDPDDSGQDELDQEGADASPE